MAGLAAVGNEKSLDVAEAVWLNSMRQACYLTF
jgi:hypothetical protein